MANRVSRRIGERLTDAELLGCLTETPIRTGQIAMRLDYSQQRIADRLRVMEGVTLVKKGLQNTWRKT